MAKENTKHNFKCGSPLHKQHLCYFVSQGFHLTDEREYKMLVENSQFMCQHCGRTARCKENLCKPVEL